MKIALIGTKGMPAKAGGVERHAQEIAKRLASYGADVTVYARKWYTEKEDCFEDGVFVKHVYSIHTKNLDTITHTFLATLDAIKSKNDVIHYHGVGPSLISFIPRIFSPNTLVITTFHSMDKKQKKWGFFAKLILRMGEWTAVNFAHRTIVVSDVLAHYVNLKYDKNAVCIPNGVADLKRSKTFDSLNKWGIEPQKYILSVARLIPDKGVHHLIEAFKGIKENNPELTQKLVIVGDSAKTDKYVKKIKQEAENCNDIIFTGTQTGQDLAELFSGAKVVVNASNNEGMPITVLEAMSYEVPVIVSDIPVHRQLIKNNDFIFRTDNAVSLSETLNKVLKKTEKDIEREIKQNKLRTQRNYNWDVIAKETFELLSFELNKHRSELVKV